jgi:hypothetical protein
VHVTPHRARGAERVSQGEFRFSSPDFYEILNAFNAMK